MVGRISFEFPTLFIGDSTADFRARFACRINSYLSISINTKDCFLCLQTFTSGIYSDRVVEQCIRCSAAVFTVKEPPNIMLLELVV